MGQQLAYRAGRRAETGLGSSRTKAIARRCLSRALGRHECVAVAVAVDAVVAAAVIATLAAAATW